MEMINGMEKEIDFPGGQEISRAQLGDHDVLINSNRTLMYTSSKIKSETTNSALNGGSALGMQVKHCVLFV
jgi:hypothetical protein